MLEEAMNELDRARPPLEDQGLCRQVLVPWALTKERGCDAKIGRRLHGARGFKVLLPPLGLLPSLALV